VAVGGALLHAKAEGLHAGEPEAVGLEAEKKGFGGDGERVEYLGSVDRLG